MGGGHGEISVLGMNMTAVPHGATGNGAVIETAGLTKRFRDRIAVAGLDLRVPGGCAYGLLGPNGWG
jgi:ABC-type transporter Mla maintaining outer membrane lipid asymmetry ATPase subunit MlaF